MCHNIKHTLYRVLYQVKNMFTKKSDEIFMN